MGQLEVRAIDAQLQGGWRALFLGMLRGAAWELTCGFCKARFRRVTYFVLSSIDCPYCQSRNVLPIRPRPRKLRRY
jgi:DNA-directed RNA polymerase subunit RPC12/RpoP